MAEVFIRLPISHWCSAWLKATTQAIHLKGGTGALYLVAQA